jgi:translation initiation factor RLI1
MAPEKERKAVREEFEVAYYTKELGRPLQRKLLQQRLNELSGGGTAGVAAAHHGDQPAAQDSASPPREDRAG